jgi:hypothetical protein
MKEILMTRILLRGVVALALVGFGWMAAKAQSTTPDFELVVDAPSGATSVRCVRGCSLAWVERGLDPNSGAFPTFDYSCTAPRCASGRIGGWTTR